MAKLTSVASLQVLAANEKPSINDVLASELQEHLPKAAEKDKVIARAIAEGALRVVSTGNDMPTIDLRRV